METIFTQQEVLLITGTSFSSQQFAERIGDSNYNLTEKEKLITACWNGLLPEILPEIFEENSSHKLYLREIREASSFIELDLGESLSPCDKEFSIDPYSFILIQVLS